MKVYSRDKGPFVTVPVETTNSIGKHTTEKTLAPLLIHSVEKFVAWKQISGKRVETGLWHLKQSLVYLVKSLFLLVLYIYKLLTIFLALCLYLPLKKKKLLSHSVSTHRLGIHSAFLQYAQNMRNS